MKALEEKYRNENGDLQKRIDSEGSRNVELTASIKDLEARIRAKEDQINIGDEDEPDGGVTAEDRDIYLRLLFARVGIPRCPDHGEVLEAQTVSQMVDQVLAVKKDTRLMLLAPVIKDRKGEHAQVFDSLARQGFVRAFVDGDGAAPLRGCR